MATKPTKKKRSNKNLSALKNNKLVLITLVAAFVFVGLAVVYLTFAATGTSGTSTTKSPDLLPVGYNQTNGPSGIWKLKFADTFDGTSLNTANWTPGWISNGTGLSGPVQTRETACYDPARVSVGNGVLKLSAVVQEGYCKGATRPYRTGNIDSHNKKEFAYGYFEARIWLDSNGTKIYNWPAWWLDGWKSWPSQGELDIMEGLSGHARSTWHGPESGGAGRSIGGWGDGQGGGWHVYASEWGPGYITSYYDGVRIGTYNSTTNVTSAPQAMVLGLQIAPENNYGGPVKVPSEMLVDYVKVWQR